MGSKTVCRCSGWRRATRCFSIRKRKKVEGSLKKALAEALRRPITTIRSLAGRGEPLSALHLGFGEQLRSFVRGDGGKLAV